MGGIATQHLRTIAGLKLAVHEDDTKLSQIVVMPDGDVKSKAGDFTVDKEAFDLIESAFKEQGNEIVIDYEHQTLGGEWSSPDGTAPAAGWIKALRHEPGKGIVASVQWTERAREMIKTEEYKYLSPVFQLKNTRPIRLHSVAITNSPAIQGIPALAAKDSVDFGFGPRTGVQAMAEMPEGSPPADIGVLIGQILAKLDVSVEEGGVADLPSALSKILTAVSQLKGEGEGEEEGEEGGDKSKAVAASIRAALDLGDKVSADEVVVAINSLKNSDNSLSVMKAEFESVKNRLAERDAADLMRPYIAANKINPKDVEDVKVCKELAMKDPTAFKHHMERRQSLVAPGRTDPPEGSLTSASGKEDELIANSLKEHKGNHREAFVALQGKLIDDECERTGHARSRAVDVLKTQYPKVFGS